MEKIINVHGMDFDSVVNLLLDYEARGEHVYCVFNGNELHSKGLTVDSAYMQVVGCTKEQYDFDMRLEAKKYLREKAEREIREIGYSEKVALNVLEYGKSKITYENVVAGLKFIAENQSLSQEELIDGLLALGCNYSLEDIKKQFTTEIELGYGMKVGSLQCGASVIVNARDQELGRAFVQDYFLCDDDESIYHFVRTVTGDDTYTRENVISIANTKKLVK